MEVIIEKRYNPWKNTLIMGIFLLIIGIIMVLYEDESLKWILMISGAFILISGLIGLVDALKYKSTVGVAIGVISGVLGVALILAPNFFQDILMILLAVMLVIIGLTTALGSLTVSSSRTNKIISIVIGVIMLALGVYALLNLNDTADIVMVVIGVILAISGVLNIYDAIQLKKYD